MTPRRLLGAVGGLALLLAAGTARADPLSEAARARAEETFLGGRPQDLDGTLGTGTRPIDVELLAVRDLLWRPAPPSRPWPAADGSLSSRRIAWLVEHARARAEGRPTPEDYPGPGPGEVDAYPRATALVLERLRRESEGASGLPEASPAWQTGDPVLRGFVEDFARRAWRVGPERRVADPEESAWRDRQQHLVRRNGWLAAATVLGYLLACGLALRAAAGRQRA